MGYYKSMWTTPIGAFHELMQEREQRLAEEAREEQERNEEILSEIVESLSIDKNKDLELREREISSKENLFVYIL